MWPTFCLALHGILNCASLCKIRVGFASGRGTGVFFFFHDANISVPYLTWVPTYNARHVHRLDGNDIGRHAFEAAGNFLRQNYGLVKLGLKGTTEQLPEQCKPLVAGLARHPTLLHLR
jgi:hypothetical protein